MNHAHFTVYRKCGSRFLHLSCFIISKKKKIGVWHRLQQRAHSCFFPARQLAGKDERKDKKKVFKRNFCLLLLIVQYCDTSLAWEVDTFCGWEEA
jgi:hypothetical protein